VLKILLDRFAELDAKMHSLNVWTGDEKAVDVATARDPECPCCAQRQFTYLAGQKQSRSVTLCGRGAVQVTPGEPVQVDLDTLSARLAPHGEVRVNPYTLRATIEFQGATHEVTVFPDGRAIIKGTSEPLVARNLYARYIGL